MILKKIKIMNYRQLQSVELDMQDSLTVLAGPNNSGKTTLISVLKGMFCDKKLGFSYSDIPISLSSMWLDKTVPVFQKIMLEYDKEKGVQKIIDEMTDNNKFSNDYTMDNFQAQIQVDYDPDNDNIQYFADYLMDLDDTKHSFYFIYTYEPSITAFEKGLNERYDRMAARVREMNYILDNLTAKQRRKNMQHIKNKDTLIELKLRKKLWNKGYRYRKNVNKLPGKPDIVLSKYKIAIFCDSEFFHGKDWDALKSRLEKSNNSEYWIKKISRNRQRDDEINKRLSFMGWTVVRFWGKEILTNSDECVSVIEDIIWSQKTNLDGSEMIDKEELL